MKQRKVVATRPNSPGDFPTLGLYVHFPWCVKKCPYCDFNSHPLTGSLPEETYIRALTAEFHARVLAPRVGNPLRFDSVFFGGGTPSLFSSRALGGFIETISPRLRAGAEMTMEANPGAAERDELRAYRIAGINRLSIGAQSFSPGSLRRLGRIHSPDETRACVAAARRGGFENINLDIMYGLPGQTTKAALADLEAAIALSPDHLSWYQLTIEPKTEFARRPPGNLPDEAAICDMEAAGHALLEQAGFERYEISAYAQPGAICRHNLVYWTFGDYLGLGAGAHGKHGTASVSSSELPFEPLSRPPPETPQWRPDEPLLELQSNISLRSGPGDPLWPPPSTPPRGMAPAAATQCPPTAPRAHLSPTFRTRNPRQPRLYLQDPCRTEWLAVGTSELAGEFMMNALRLVGGVERRLFETRTGLPWSLVAPTWRMTSELGLTEPDRIAATPLGLRHLDTLVEHFL